MSKEEPGSAFSRERAAKLAHREVAILTGCGRLAQTPRATFQSLCSRNTLPQQLFDKFLELTRSELQGEDKLQTERRLKL